jgi:hypothetical protein
MNARIGDRANQDTAFRKGIMGRYARETIIFSSHSSARHFHHE